MVTLYSSVHNFIDYMWNYVTKVRGCEAEYCTVSYALTFESID